jgi:ribonucrease Y
MEILGAAAILGVALVVVAVLMSRGGRRAAAGAGDAAAQANLSDREENIAGLEERLRVRAAELDRRARELDEQTRALEAEREQLALRERDHEAALERISGLSATQAKERLLREVVGRLCGAREAGVCRAPLLLRASPPTAFELARVAHASVLRR